MQTQAGEQALKELQRHRGAYSSPHGLDPSAACTANTLASLPSLPWTVGPPSAADTVQPVIAFDVGKICLPGIRASIGLFYF